MNEFDEDAAAAMGETREKFRKEREAIINTDAGQIAKLFPDEGDRAAMNVLMEKIKSATSDNEAAQAYKDFTKAATLAGIRAAGEAFNIGKKLIL